jgi:hypothetical protein
VKIIIILGFCSSRDFCFVVLQAFRITRRSNAVNLDGFFMDFSSGVYDDCKIRLLPYRTLNPSAKYEL